MSRLPEQRKRAIMEKLAFRGTRAFMKLESLAAKLKASGAGKWKKLKEILKLKRTAVAKKGKALSESVARATKQTRTKLKL
jgi:hypothetical protein